MTRHTFSWSSLIMGLLFLAAVGSWAVWKSELITPREFSFIAAGALIVLGLAGVAATLWHARSTPHPTHPTIEGENHEATDPQP